MNLKELHESWVKTGYPSRTEIQKAIEGLLAEQSQTPTEAGLREAIKIMEHARGSGGPVAYHDAEDSVGYNTCCGTVSYKDHDTNCWYREMCEFLDNHPTPHAPNPADNKGNDKGLVEELYDVLSEYELSANINVQNICVGVHNAIAKFKEK